MGLASGDGSDDPTVMPTGAGGAPRGAARPADDDSFLLPPGSRLHEFELIQRLGDGGFGIVYLAWDHTLDRQVALKEYMPPSLAVRLPDGRISPRSERCRETFEAGMRSFINEAKLLASFDHPSLVKVLRFWQANGTAYMAMPFYEGRNLRETVRAMAQPPDEQGLRDLLDPLTEALAVIHAEHCYHRDIAPDNVLLLADSGRPLLLDFGAARRVIGDMTQDLTVILKPGYAPVEQYAEVPGMKQGPWTDVYALAAVVYWAVSGRTPPPAVGRLVQDACVPLTQLAAGRYSEAFLQVVDRALVVRPEERTPDIATLRQELGLPPPVLPRRGASRSLDPDATVVHTAAPSSRSRSPSAGLPVPPPTQGAAPSTATGRAPILAPATTIPVPAPAAITSPAAPVAPAAPQVSPFQTQAAIAPTSETGQRRAWTLGAAAVLTLGLLAAGWTLWGGRSTPAPVQAGASAPEAAPSQAPAPAPAVQHSPAPDPAASPLPADTTPNGNAALPAVVPPPPAAADADERSPVRQTLPGQSAESQTEAPARQAPAMPRPAAPVADAPRQRSTTTASPKPATTAASPAQPPSNSAECARLLQRMSLGDGGSDVVERFRALGCR